MEHKTTPMFNRSQRLPDTYMIFALWTAVTFFLPCFSANSNAYFAMRMDLWRVIIFILSTTPGTVCNMNRTALAILSSPKTANTTFKQNVYKETKLFIFKISIK